MDVRDKLVELLDDDKLQSCPNCDYTSDKCMFCGYLNPDDNCLSKRVADHLIANGVTVQEWISVKDRLPQVGLDVLFVCENKQYGVGAYSDTYRDFFSGQFPVKNVTHWCELPQPPKGE